MNLKRITIDLLLSMLLAIRLAHANEMGTPTEEYIILERNKYALSPNIWATYCRIHTGCEFRYHVMKNMLSGEFTERRTMGGKAKMGDFPKNVAIVERLKSEIAAFEASDFKTRTINLNSSKSKKCCIVQ